MKKFTSKKFAPALEQCEPRFLLSVSATLQDYKAYWPQQSLFPIPNTQPPMPTLPPLVGPGT